MNDPISLLATRAANLKLAGGWPDVAPVSFIFGFPTPEALPFAGMEQAALRALRGYGEWPLQYDGAPGRDALINLLVHKLQRDQGISCGPENILLTAGSSQAIEFIAELFLDAGDTLLVESPTFLGTVRTLRNWGVHCEGVPLDQDGVRVDALEAQLKRLHAEGRPPKLFYIIPNFQNPTGVTTTLERRKRIVALAREYNFVLLEDDAYYDINWSGQRIPPLYALEGGERTFYTGTFSKIMAPGLRLGWMVAPKPLLDRINTLHPVENAAPFSIHTAWEFCRAGGLDTNIAALVARYQRRCDTMLDALDECMPEACSWTRPLGGFFIWLTLPNQIDAGALLKDVRARGVDYLPGAFCTPDGSLGNCLRLAFSYAPEDKIAEGIKVIADCVRDAAS